MINKIPFCIQYDSLNIIILGMQKNSQKGKLKLTIKIPQSEKKLGERDEEDQEIYVKPVYSTKNTRKPQVRFNFDQGKIETARQRKSKKLEREKDMLLKSLNVLKVGAISAIAEKQEQIDNMRSQMVGQEVKQLQDEIEQLMQERLSLKEDIKQLQEKLQFERESYMRLLEEKDRVIEQLYVELGSTQIQIEKLQKYQEIKQKKIKIIQQQNNYLFHQLEEEKISHLKQLYQNTENSIFLPSPTPFEPFQPIPEAQTLSQKSKSALEDNHSLILLESRHRQQLNELTLFYEKRLSQMRQIYQKQLQIWPLEQNRQNSLNNQLMEDVVSLKQTVVPVAYKLSNELNTRLLSDYYSVTKRDISKYDKSSIQASDEDPIDFNFTFLKRVNNTPVSQTTSSIRVEDGLKFMVAQVKKRQETEISEEKTSEKQLNRNEWQGKGSATSFMLGALTGGAVTFIINHILRK